jgi:hypothetical protein
LVEIKEIGGTGWGLKGLESYGRQMHTNRWEII